MTVNHVPILGFARSNRSPADHSYFNSLNIIRKEVFDIPAKKKSLKQLSKSYCCTICGKEYSSEDNFYMSRYSPLFEANDHRLPFCKQCVTDMYTQLVQDYGSDAIAVQIMCHYMDIPYIESLYASIMEKYKTFNIGVYIRNVVNNTQYSNKTFVDTLLALQPSRISQKEENTKEEKWSLDDMSNKKKVVSIIGYDPFEGYPEKDRKFCFNELIKYLGEDDDISNDTYKLSQIIQIVNNNNQIHRYNLKISALDPIRDGEDIKLINGLKSSLVSANDKIAKENEISVKNRSSKEVGKSTLGGLMRRMREMDFEEIEANYYDQLQGAGTRWAAEMSQKTIIENGMFDENDKQEIFAKQRQMILDLSEERDSLKEENRLLKVDYKNLKENLTHNTENGDE